MRPRIIIHGLTIYYPVFLIPMFDYILKRQNVYNNLVLDKPIYKFMPLKYVLSLFQNKYLYYQKTSLWEDPYENFFLKQDFRMNDGTSVDATNLIPGIFGMCWTLQRESDALWRIYSKGKNAVRIQTTASQLFDATYLKDDDYNHAYIGKVQYKRVNELEEKMLGFSPISPLDLNSIWTQSMFLKRMEFKHEREVRSILIFSRNEPQYNQDHLEYSINPQEFIKEITLDPRLDEDSVDLIKAQLLEVGVNPNIINKSQLYSFNRHKIKLQ